MSDFLARVARRAAGSSSVVHLRPRARYERAEPGSTPLRTDEVAAGAHPQAPVALPAVATHRPDPAPGPAEAPTPARTDPARTDPGPTGAAVRHAPVRTPQRRPVQRPAATTPDTSGALRPALASPAPPDGWPGHPRDVGGHEMREAVAPALAEVRRLPVGRDVAPSAPAPSTDELLAGHVVPALVEAGLLRDRDVAIQREPAMGMPSTRTPGARPVVRVTGEPPRTSSGGDVHVHIAHVEVVQPGPRPAAPARTKPPRAPAVDHDAYLAGRRQERS